MRKLDNSMPYWKKTVVLVAVFLCLTFLSALIYLGVIALDRSPLYGTAFGTLIIFGGTTLVYCNLFEEYDFFKQIAKQPFKLKWLFATLLILFATFTVIDYISVENENSQRLQDMVRDGSYFGLVKLIVALALLPAIFEELFFRGLLQKFLIQWTKSALAGIVVAAAIFSLVHWDADNFMARFFLGLLLGLLYQYSGRLWTSMVFHFLNNTVAALLIWLLLRGDIISDNLYFPWYFAIFSIAFIGFFIVYNELKNTRSIRNNSKELTHSRLNTSFRNFEERDF